jgi:hypothetical protein
MGRASVVGASAASPRHLAQHSGPRRPREITHAQSVLAPRPYKARPQARTAGKTRPWHAWSQLRTFINTDGLIKFGALAKTGALFRLAQPDLLRLSLISVCVGAVGLSALLYNQLRSHTLVAPAFAAVYPPSSEPLKAALLTRAAHLQKLADASDETSSIHVKSSSSGIGAGPTAASVIARDWKSLIAVREANARVAPAPKEAKIKSRVKLASLDTAVPPVSVIRPTPMPSFPASVDARTSLVSFQTAPFPYHGKMPGSDRPFLNAGDEGHRGHVNFRGRVLWESQTFSDDRVLLHIPPGFDPQRPAVMVVFFHGHGANLAEDVRDRQRVPAQITEAGMNAVLVAPQFAVDAADSSAGKFWEPGGFKRFLDEAAVKLAKLYGQPGSAASFANMPIVIVAYSGGFGPTLSVLDRGGVAKSRIRGLVLLDALYAGIDQFADWIAANRSAFFVSSYTPHTAHHNADLEHELSERAVPYSTELRRNHLQGMVTFLPAGDVSHRDFVTHAWADNPVEDILLRMTDVAPRIDTTTVTARRN